jgi:hypothetical protein
MLMSTKKLGDVSSAKDTVISSTSANRLRQYVDAVLWITKPPLSRSLNQVLNARMVKETTRQGTRAEVLR